jgi:hypothetical protein
MGQCNGHSHLPAVAYFLTILHVHPLCALTFAAGSKLKDQLAAAGHDRANT